MKGVSFKKKVVVQTSKREREKGKEDIEIREGKRKKKVKRKKERYGAVILTERGFWLK